VPANDIRLYPAEDVLNIASRLQQERSILAKTIAAVVSDREARQRYLGNARAGGSALWLFAPTEDRADQLVGFLADYHYGSLRYSALGAARPDLPRPAARRPDPACWRPQRPGRGSLRCA
jgi:hypothetical protein